jgi:hypothetical protein
MIIRTLLVYSAIALAGAITPPRSRLLSHAARRLRVPARPRMMAASEATIAIARTAGGGLGLEVSNDNLILAHEGQPELRVGDVIVAVDGTPLDGRYVGKVIDRSASAYEFTVSRESPASVPLLESAVYTFCAELFNPNVDAAEVDAESRARLLGIVRALEVLQATGSATAGDAPLLGFWKMVVGHGSGTVSGMSKMAQGDGCSLVAHWQCFTEASPPVQVVEVVADPLLTRHSVATLKGGLELTTDSDGHQATVETYDRLEVGNELVSADILKCERVSTYLSEQLRIVRPRPQGGADADANPEFYAYWRTTAEAAQTEILRLADAPLGGDDLPGGGSADEDVPRWAQARNDGYEAETSAIP